MRGLVIIKDETKVTERKKKKKARTKRIGTRPGSAGGGMRGSRVKKKVGAAKDG
jgi:hypothetical protein